MGKEAMITFEMDCVLLKKEYPVFYRVLSIFRVILMNIFSVLDMFDVLFNLVFHPRDFKSNHLHFIYQKLDP